VRIVFVTCPPNRGAALLRQLVEEHLVAGGNLIRGAQSIYRWKDQICDEAEEILWMETAADRVQDLLARLPELHPYEVPKVLTFTPDEGLEAYFRWVRAETRPG
jgi:periplasmic divalent cation tolerance protein